MVLVRLDLCQRFRAPTPRYCLHPSLMTLSFPAIQHGTFHCCPRRIGWHPFFFYIAAVAPINVVMRYIAIGESCSFPLRPPLTASNVIGKGMRSLFWLARAGTNCESIAYEALALPLSYGPMNGGKPHQCKSPTAFLMGPATSTAHFVQPPLLTKNHGLSGLSRFRCFVRPDGFLSCWGKPHQ